MLFKITCIVVLVACSQVWGYEDNGDEPSSEYRDEDGDDGFGNYHQDYDEDDNPVRVKRFKAKQTVKTLSPLEIQQVKGAIDQILSGYSQDNPFTPLPAIQGSNEKRSISDSPVVKRQSAQSSRDIYFFDSRTTFTEYTDVLDAIKSEIGNYTNIPLTTELFKTSTLTTDLDYDTKLEKHLITKAQSLPAIPGTLETKVDIISSTTAETAAESDATTKISETISYETETNTGLTGATINILPFVTLPLFARTNTGDVKSEINNILGRINQRADDDHTSTESDRTEISSSNIELKDNADSPTQTTKTFDDDEKATTPAAKVIEKTEVDPTALNEGPKNLTTAESATLLTKESATLTTKESATPTDYESDTQTNEDYEDEQTTTRKSKKTRRPGNKSAITKITRSRPNKQRTTRTTPTTTTTTRFKLDVPALLAIIANLTYDYEVNLTDKLNKTLLKYSIPTCETPTTTVKRGIFVDYDANATGTIVAKCFVCGLEVEGIPRNAYCADAFAGDFQPMMPADMTARGQLSKFRKYCRFADVPRYIWNMTQPRSIFGRWTGGCSVRWIDLSGVYTQRSCRNRDRAVLGRHFVSKRMAKLEMALKHTDNGCITSPMATLVPLSRGISLYARFHACVCTGSWCNAANIRIPWTGGGLLLLLLPYFSPHFII